MFTCDICFPDRMETIDGVTAATLPTRTGEVQILDGHAEAFFLLTAGDILLEAGGGRRTIGIGDGCGYFKEGVLTFIATPAAG